MGPDVQAAARTEVTKHLTTVPAPAQAVYDLIADTGCWPWMFGPTVHVEHLDRTETEERLRIWAFANGDVHNWTSLRRLDAQARRIEFRQEVPSRPVASMGGAWVLSEQPDGTTLVELLHDFAAIDDDPESLSLIALAVDRNSKAELANLAATARLHDQLADLVVSFDDTVLIPGSAQAVYDFLYRAQDWPERLPHVARVELREDTPNRQVMEMDTRDPDGSVHTTKSARVCFPHSKIVYKQVSVPPFMTAHVGAWLLEETPDGVAATSRHTVVFRRDAIRNALGPTATVDDARNAIRNALGGNSRTTLQRAKSFIGGDSQ